MTMQKTKLTLSIAIAIGLTGSLASTLAAGSAAVWAAQSKPAQQVVVKNELTCTAPPKGMYACLAIRHTIYVRGHRAAVRPLATLQPMGGLAYGANQLRKAYGVTELGSHLKVIAVVDAYHSDSAFQDLADYRSTYGLGAMDDCGALSAEQSSSSDEPLTEMPDNKRPCFLQLDQEGNLAANRSTQNAGWAQETSLDIEMATAICPHCSILLVEARTPSMADFNQAVSIAAGFNNVRSISNSYGGNEVSERKFGAYADAQSRGIAVVASSGDSGYGVSAPASFASVIAVGGTTLHVDSRGKYLSETAWRSAGSGCSVTSKAPTWQPFELTGCNGKLTADVAAVADPATGVAVAFEGGWYTFGGTSVAAPIIAGMYAIGPDFGASAGDFTFANREKLHDITAGITGNCSVPFWCGAREGWDGPTGMGSPKGSDAF
jgi:Subtilase family